MVPGMIPARIATTETIVITGTGILTSARRIGVTTLNMQASINANTHANTHASGNASMHASTSASISVNTTVSTGAAGKGSFNERAPCALSLDWKLTRLFEGADVCFWTESF